MQAASPCLRTATKRTATKLIPGMAKLPYDARERLNPNYFHRHMEETEATWSVFKSLSDKFAFGMPSLSLSSKTGNL